MRTHVRKVFGRSARGDTPPLRATTPPATAGFILDQNYSFWKVRSSPYAPSGIRPSGVSFRVSLCSCCPHTIRYCSPQRVLPAHTGVAKPCASSHSHPQANRECREQDFATGGSEDRAGNFRGPERAPKGPGPYPLQMAVWTFDPRFARGPRQPPSSGLNFGTPPRCARQEGFQMLEAPRHVRATSGHELTSGQLSVHPGNASSIGRLLPAILGAEADPREAGGLVGPRHPPTKSQTF